ncbi:MAG: hypothetical protein H6620_05630 [Halobacteriovoraceae bacterium]|nr:hypothetical protein [Halobacteriovoraceae bacterium]
MKKIFAILLLGFSLNSLACLELTDIKLPQSVDPTTHNENGCYDRIETGKKYSINVISTTWCGWCRELAKLIPASINDLNKLATFRVILADEWATTEDEMIEKANNTNYEGTFVAVDQTSSYIIPQEINSHLSELEAQGKNPNFPGFKVSGYPTILVKDSNGKVLFAQAGYSPNTFTNILKVMKKTIKQ